MKIALSTSVVERGRSGVGQYILSLVRALLPAAPRHEFTLYALEEDMPLFDFARGAMRLAPVPEFFRAPVANILWHQTEMPRLARLAGAEVLHVPSYRRMLWPRPCALVATIHDLAPFHLSGKYDRLRTFYGRRVARALAHRQDRIIAVSPLTARDLVAHFHVPRDRIEVVPNGIDHDRFKPGPREAARRAVSDPRGIHAPFFLYVSRLEHPGKNHLRLIDAFDGFKAATGSGWHLVLGGADWHGAEAIHGRIRASPFARDIHRLGFVPSEELPQWYRAAGAFVFPSLFEGFGLPPVEAMACGCPVLASGRGALAETLNDAAVPLDPESAEQMQAQLERMAGDEAWRARWRASGLERARAFDWGATAAATLAAYARACDGAGRARRPNRLGSPAPPREGEHLLAGGRPAG